MKRAMIVVALAVVAAAAVAGIATPSAPPVGKLPRGTTVTLKTLPGKLVVLTLPRPTLKGGVWRVARSFDTLVVQQRSERKLKNGAVQITLETTGPGTTRVVFALTKGETARAYAARTYEITVGDKPPPETR